MPLLPVDPLFHPSTLAPHGQHWLHSTRVTSAWRLVKYDQPWAVNLQDADRTIAIIDSGIHVDHPEFNERDLSGTIMETKIHEDSQTFAEGAVGPFSQCPCDPEDLEGLDVENIDDLFWQLDPGAPFSFPHGTIVSGIAGAYAGNGQGIAGACWDCGLLVLRVNFVESFPCGDADIENCLLCTTAEDAFQPITDSIRYAAGWEPGLPTHCDSEWEPVRARVISISLVGPQVSEAACDAQSAVYQLWLAAQQATARGCVIVIMSGNTNVGGTGIDATCGTDPGAPANPTCHEFDPLVGWPPLARVIGDMLAIMPETITVGGVCMDYEQWHSISRINPPMSCLPACAADWYESEPIPGEPDRAPALSVVVPIENIVTTFALDENCVGPAYGALYDNLGDRAGTSWAPPQVAGVVALMLKANPSLMAYDIKKILNETALDIGPTGYDRWTGWGLLNAQAAVQRAMILALPANFNGDESICPIDAVEFMSALGAGDVMADLDLDTAHTSDDLAIFLNSYTAEE